MTLHSTLAFSALAASLLLLAFSPQRALALVAALAAATEVAMATGLVRLGVSGVPLALVLGLALAIPGLIAWLRAAGKPAISAAVIVAFIGLVQVALQVVGRLDRTL
jgi:hypothetical protein